MTELIWEAQCCRLWPVLGFTQVGECGRCGTVPVPTGRVWVEKNNTGGEKNG